jgi:hypothetical protein
MNKIAVLGVLIHLFVFNTFSQKEFELVPDSCELVVSMDLVRIGRSFSMNDAANYQFVSFIFENYLNTDGKSVNLNELGMDLHSNPTYFAGNRRNYDYSGVIIKLNKPNTFINKVISDNIIRKELIENTYFVEDRALYLIHNNFYIAMTVNAKEELAFAITDSIFDANEWQKPFRWDNFLGGFDWGSLDLPPLEEIIEESVEETEEVEEVEEAEAEDDELMEEPKVKTNWDSIFAYDDEHNYYGIKDSIANVLSEKFAEQFRQMMLKNTPGLLANNTAFKTSCSRKADAMVYVDSKGAYNPGEFPYVSRNPFLKGYNNFMQDAWQTGYMNFTTKGMDIEWVNHVGDEMMSVFRAMSKSKFDKKLLNYIPQQSMAFMTMNVNTAEAYKEFKKIYMPKMENSGDPDKMFTAAVWALVDEIIDENALFDLYLSKAFVSFNGIRDMVVERISYDYDEETFEYAERIEAGIDKVPALTMGMSTTKTGVFEKFLKALAARDNEVVTKVGDYYKLKRGPIPGITFYVMIKGNVMILTNEQDIVRNYQSGYGKQAITGRLMKEAGSNQMMYMYLNMLNMPQKLNELIVNPADRRFVQAMTDKPGVLEIKMGEMTKQYFALKGTYEFQGNYKNGAYYLMDVLNLMMSYEDPYFED